MVSEWYQDKPFFWFNNPIIQGGLRGINRNGGRMSTRQVTGVSENVRLNRALWSLGVEMARLAA